MQKEITGSLGWEDPLEDSTATHSSVLAGELYGQRGLVGCSPWGHKEADKTEATYQACASHFQIYVLFLRQYMV